MTSKMLLTVFLLGEVIAPVAGSNLYKVWVYYSGKFCEGTPYNTYVESDRTCAIEQCFEDGNSSATGAGVVTIDCTSDYKTNIRTAFGKSPYILVEVYADSECETLSYAQGFSASGNCEGSPNLNSTSRVITTLEADGSVVLKYYRDALCDDAELTDTFSADKDTVSTHECDESWTRWYSMDGDDGDGSDKTSSSGGEGNTTSAESGGIKTPIVAGIIVGGVLILALIALIAWCCKRRTYVKQTETQQQATASLNTASLDACALRGQVGLWDDDVITAKRIPRDKVKVKKLVSRGAFGEVYEGTFNGKKVAVKVLLPHMRGNLKQVNDFLAEAKLTASMEHPHVVGFVGVAWDSLSDVCVALEFMDGGDLRELLSKYESAGRPVGFDREKVTIALHVCHALTYLHSLLPPVIHRDLKSRNILLNKALAAKITDFGISRERLDQTMTAGVGTSLWMAPEVMLGERYDVKADMFSFGVVLSELDLHALPYSQAKEKVRDANGRHLPDAAILQQVAMGQLEAGFSSSSPASIVELGRACVALNPIDRPTAAEALYRLQVILAKEVL
jgi:serine/threonine-protein kinase TNNI3K